jgi:hypothetical protein
MGKAIADVVMAVSLLRKWRPQGRRWPCYLIDRYRALGSINDRFVVAAPNFGS